MEVALFRFEIEVILLQNVKNSFDYRPVLFHSLSEDEDIVDVNDHNSFSNELSKEVVHHRLESRW